jgi:hypothetical protein
MGMYFIALEWLEKIMIPCIFKSVFHIDCPGCGLQRSFFLLLKGNLADSINMYWATIPMLFMFAFLLLHLKFNFKGGTRLLIFIYSINGILIFCHYFYKLSNHN